MKPRTVTARLLGVAVLVRHAEELQALRVQRVDVELGLHHPVEIADGGEASLEGERADALGEHRPADVVDHQVDPFAAGRLHDRVVEVRLSRFDADIETERF